MSYDNQTELLAHLRDEGDLVRIAAEVDPVFEIAEIAARVRRSATDGGPAMLFEQVRGSLFPVIANLLGAAPRLCRALGLADINDAGRIMQSLLSPPQDSGSWLDSLRRTPALNSKGSEGPRLVKSGLCQQVVKLGRDVRLDDLPILHHWPGERAAVITAGVLLYRDPETGVMQFDDAPLQRSPGERLVIAWNPHGPGPAILDKYRNLGRQMPVAVVLGGDPALRCAASAPLPPHVDVLSLVSAFRDRGLSLVRGRTVDLEVLADAEIVLEGLIDVAAPVEEAAVTSPAGLIIERGGLPAMQITAVTHRATPLYPAFIPGPPPSERAPLDKLHERLLLPLVQQAAPEILDIAWPVGGAEMLFVRFQKRYPYHARRVMDVLCGQPRLMTVKMLVAVDADVDVQQPAAVWAHVGSHVHAARDVSIVGGPGDILNAAAPHPGGGSRMMLDATRKLPEEGHPRANPSPAASSEEIQRKVSDRRREFGFQADWFAVRDSMTSHD